VIEYIGKMAVGTASLGPKIASGSSPARATKFLRWSSHLYRRSARREESPYFAGEAKDDSGIHQTLCDRAKEAGHYSAVRGNDCPRTHCGRIFVSFREPPVAAGTQRNGAEDIC
jgi:hypothetical protein